MMRSNTSVRRTPGPSTSTPLLGNGRRRWALTIVLLLVAATATSLVLAVGGATATHANGGTRTTGNHSPPPDDDALVDTVVDPPWPEPPLLQGAIDVRLDRFDATVSLRDGLASTALDLTFHNAGNVTQDVTVRVPLPPGATLTAFQLQVDDRTLVGEVKERAQARQTFEQAKERGEDAVLLEQASDGQLRLLVNVQPGSARTLHASYVEHIDMDAGARVYRLPTSALSGLAQPVGGMGVALTLASAHGVTGFTTPALRFDHIDRTHGLVEARLDRSAPEDPDDLIVTWTEGGGAWLPAMAIADAPNATDVSWTSVLASIALRPEDADAALPRDIVFVLDKSGSMGGYKIDQARESLREVLLTLRPDDRYAILAFNDDVHAVTEGLTSADGDSISTTRERLSHVGAGGSTNLDGGLQRALETLGAADPGRVPIVVLLSDGLPTAGITDHASIVSRMVAANAGEAGVHVLAIGLDADDTFLEDLAARSGGSLTQLDPHADLADRLAGFYASLGHPILTDVRVVVSGTEHSEVLPRTLPALYRDDTLRVLFRGNLSNLERLHVTVTGVGTSGRMNETFTFDVADLPVAPEVGRLWGAAHVAALLSEERVEGTRPGLRADIIEAAKRYGVVTPYTSWVIVADEPVIIVDDQGPVGGADGADGSASSVASPPPAAPGGTNGDQGDQAARYDQGAKVGPGAPPPSSPLVVAQRTAEQENTVASGDADGGDPQDTAGDGPGHGTGRSHHGEGQATPGPGILLALIALAGVAWRLGRRPEG